jgi:hypothetical protein
MGLWQYYPFESLGVMIMFYVVFAIIFMLMIGLVLYLVISEIRLIMYERNSKKQYSVNYLLDKNKRKST